VPGGYGAIFASPGELNKCHLYTYLSRAGSRGSFEKCGLVICHGETVKKACKNCDKFMNYIDRVSTCIAVDSVSCY